MTDSIQNAAVKVAPRFTLLRVVQDHNGTYAFARRDSDGLDAFIPRHIAARYNLRPVDEGRAFTAHSRPSPDSLRERHGGTGAALTLIPPMVFDVSPERPPVRSDAEELDLLARHERMLADMEGEVAALRSGVRTLLDHIGGLTIRLDSMTSQLKAEQGWIETMYPYVEDVS